MFCAKCGSELGVGVKFCAKCGTPVNAPAEESAPTPALESVAPEMTARPMASPIMPAVPEIKPNKNKLVALCIAVAMILVVAFGFLTLKGVKGEWKFKEYREDGVRLETDFSGKITIKSDSLIADSGDHIKEYKIRISGDMIQKYSESSGKYKDASRVAWDGLDLMLINPDDSGECEIYSRVWSGAFLGKMIGCIVAFIALAFALITMLLKKPKNYSFEGTYSGTTTSLPLVDRYAEPAVAEPEYVAPVEPVVAEPEYVAPVEPVVAEPEYVAPVEPAVAEPEYVAPVEPVVAEPEYVAPVDSVTEDSEDVSPVKTVVYTPSAEVAEENSAPLPKSDLDVYNTVDEFEAMSSSYSPSTAAPAVEYPTDAEPKPTYAEYPTDSTMEEKKSAGDKWFSAAGDL